MPILYVASNTLSRSVWSLFVCMFGVWEGMMKGPRHSTAPLPLHDFISTGTSDVYQNASQTSRSHMKMPCPRSGTHIMTHTTLKHKSTATSEGTKQKGQLPWSGLVNLSVMCHSQRVSMHFTHGRSPHACDVYRAFFIQVWDLTGI